METLEDRRLMAATVGVADGVLRITGDGGYDLAIVEKTTIGDVKVTYFNGYRTVESTFISKYGIREIIFNGGNGGAEFDNNTSLPSTAIGGAERDIFSGGSSSDVFFGFGGDDRLFSHAGNDRVHGGDGDDVLMGYDGNDQLYGGSGRDGILGQGGDDQLYGADGADRLEGGDGNDYLDGGHDPVTDLMVGGHGADTFATYFNDDVIDFYGPSGDTWIMSPA